MATGIEQPFPVAEDELTDVQWRNLFGDEPGIFGDTNGSAFGLTLPAGTDVAEIGSATIDSVARVGGFGLLIPAGSTQSITIPPSTNSTGRTDLIVARFDPSLATTTPVRLHRIAGTEGSTTAPPYDSGPPGVEDLPLWAVTRKGVGGVAQGLNQASRVDRRRWVGPSMLAADGAPLPPSVPLGTRIRRQNTEYVRDLVRGAPEWLPTAEPIETTGGFGSSEPGWSTGSTAVPSTMTRDGRRRAIWLEAKRTATADITPSATGHVTNFDVFRIAAAADRPATPVTFAGLYNGGSVDYGLTGIIGTDGYVTVAHMAPNAPLKGNQDAAGLWSVRIYAEWYVA